MEFLRRSLNQLPIMKMFAIGGRLYIGNPKQPTISVYTLVDGEYEVQQFWGNERVVSSIVGNLELIAEQIFRAGG